MDDFSQIMTPFDLSISSPTLQMIKLLIPFLPPQNQRMIAIYIKFIEFQNTFSHFRGFCNSDSDPFMELMKIMPQSAMDSYENIMNMMSMVDMFNSDQKEGEKND